MIAALALEHGGAFHFLIVPFAFVVARRLAPFHILPLERLAQGAVGTLERPHPLVGRFEFPLGVVAFLAGLAHEQALAQPTERRHARLRLSHVTRWPPPCLIADEPADGSALEICLVVRSQNPKRHAVAEMNGSGLAALNCRDDRHHAHGWIDQRFERLAQPRRIVRAETARHGRIRNGTDMFLGPGPRRTTVGRLPDLAPDVVKL